VATLIARTQIFTSLSTLMVSRTGDARPGACLCLRRLWATAGERTWSELMIGVRAEALGCNAAKPFIPI